MASLDYKINNTQYSFPCSGSIEFEAGKDLVLSNENTDISHGQPWYPLGHESVRFLSETEFKNLQSGISSCIKQILQNELGIETTAFRLEDYHRWVDTDDKHFQVVSITRDLFPQDFGFSVDTLINRISENLGFKLTDIDPDSGQQWHIIVRLNRPGSSDFNPPHKDMYVALDKEGKIKKFINIWIPISGVTEKSSLPIVPKSHLLSESKIVRSSARASKDFKFAGNIYRVNTIKSWDGGNGMERANVNYGQALLFSSHLIHGLGTNLEQDRTRVALEFRLFKK